MEIDSNAEDAVGCSSTLYSAATAMNLQLTLLLQSLQMIQIDQVLCPSFVERNLFLHSLIGRTSEGFHGKTLAVGVQEVGQHLQSTIKTVVELAKLVL